MSKPVYKRVVLKLSGDILKGSDAGGIDFRVVSRIARELAEIQNEGVELGVVVGGGNLFRGADIAKDGYHRINADNMGMLSTVINALALQGELEGLGAATRVMSAINISEFVEPFIHRRALRHIEKGRIVLFAAGTGNPYFTTDTAAALRASQLEAEIILKGTKVDGIYDSDPNLVDGAIMFNKVDYMEVIRLGLKVMDLTAITFCRDFRIPILVFNILKRNNIKNILFGENIGTLVEEVAG